ncbi:MAG: hypothetical protein H6677_14055 [Candidatus Obscuribacterales bacterium]|nr:hypothetical protein [Candidatus Obscuribacterales bacterium]
MDQGETPKKTEGTGASDAGRKIESQTENSGDFSKDLGLGFSSFNDIMKLNTLEKAEPASAGTAPGEPVDGFKQLPDGNKLLEMLRDREQGQDQNRFPFGMPQGRRFEFPSRPAIGSMHQGKFFLNDRMKQGIMDVIQKVGPELGVNLDPARGELNLNMDFASIYDRSVPRDSPEYSPEVRAMLSGLKNLSLSADSIRMSFDGEKVLSMGDKGIAAQYKMALGAKNGETAMKVNTTETSLSLSDIEGLQVVERSGRRLDVHAINFDTKDPKDPRGSITMDNPMPRPQFLPGAVPWPETVTVPMLIPQDQKAELAEKLPSSIRAIDAVRAGAKSGDLTETMRKVSLADMSDLLSWTFKNRGTIDFASSWKAPDIRSMVPGGQQNPNPNSRLDPRRMRY